MEQVRPGEADGAESPGETPARHLRDALGRLLPTLSAAVGLVVTLTAVDVDRSWRLVAVGLGVVGLGCCLSASLLRRAGRRTTAAGVGLLVVAGAVLVVSPSPALPAPPRPRPRLALSHVDVSNRDGLVRLDVTVHNLGSQRAALTGLRLRFDHFGYLPECYTAGYVPASAPYRHRLPDRPATGSSVTIPLHEEVGADQVDRFVIALHPPQRLSGPGPDAYSLGGSFLYQVTASLTADVQPTLSLGQAVFSAPLDPDPVGEVWDLADPGHRNRWARSIGASAADLRSAQLQRAMACLDRNSQVLRDVLALPGIRSEAFAASATAPPH